MTNIYPCLARYDNAVHRVIKQRHKNAEDLYEQQIRHVVNVLYVFIEYTSAAHCGRVRVNVNEVKDTERNDSRDLMQLSQDERIAETYWHLISAICYTSNID